MSRLKFIMIALLLFGCGTIYAQYGAVTSYCVKGATPANTSGLNSINTLQGIVPGGPAGCLVQVYLTGTTTPATIYSTSGGGILSNPFRASLSGQWLFYAATGQAYDVVLSSGVFPNNYTSPVTLTGMVSLGTGGNGFPITLGSTSIAGSSTTTSLAGLTVNGVNLNSAGSSTLFLNQAGGYTAPVGSGFPFTLGSTSITAGSTTTALTGLTVNGVTLNSAGSTGLFLNQAGGYTSASGFPITLGSTSISSGSTTTSLIGLTVNGVTLSATGLSTQYLDGTGGYSTPAGITSINSQIGPAFTVACATGLTCTTTSNTVTISLATTFTITSFTGGSTVELGTSVVNPSFAATYSVTPASANITNTESISSPTNLTTPFTSGTIIGTFVHTSIETTTFTLSATQGATLTATQTINWEPAIFGGVGTAGATSTVTASGTTAVLSTSNVLPRLQLGAETVGQTFGPFTPSSGGQNVYLLLTGGSHTFVDGNGFVFPMNTPLTVSFVNVNGVHITMYLYQSTNTLYLPVSVKVAS